MSKVVFITGASSGIGRAIGELLHQKGMVVYGTSRNPSKITDSPFPLLPLDVNDPQTITEAVAWVLAEKGRIDVLVNNAGVGITGPIEETPDAEINKAFDTNFYGPIRVIKAVMPAMRKAGQGRIINITSIAGYMGLPYRGIYSASKAALGVVTETLRLEAREFGISFTTVAPGDFATNIAAGRYHAPLKEDSAYYNNYKVSLDLMNEHVDAGEDPAAMANFVYRLINKKKVKVHYRVGAPLQRLSIVLKRLLPDTWYESMLRKHYKL